MTTAPGIRDELQPWLSMTIPPSLRGRNLDDAADLVGKPLGRTRLLLLGWLPVEYAEMRLLAVERYRFHEQSSMLLLSTWEHERKIHPLDEGHCEVVDRLAFEPRVALLRPLVRTVVGALFSHRHRRLARWASAVTPTGDPL